MEKQKELEKKPTKFGLLARLNFIRFLNFGSNDEMNFNFARHFTDLYFQQACPACRERMKYKRKVTSGILYTCYNCYKSWIEKDRKFIETKLETK